MAVPNLRPIGRSITADEHELLEKLRSYGFPMSEHFIDTWLNDPDDERSLMDILSQEIKPLSELVCTIKSIEDQIVALAIHDPKGLILDHLWRQLVLIGERMQSET